MELRDYIDDTTSTEELETKITALRSMMIQTGIEHGLNHNKTIEISQQLDTFLTEMQKRERQPIFA